ncbi:MAG: sigma 54-interacting transcriptional regulator [Thermodesulfobacteriota bacterium]
MVAFNRLRHRLMAGVLLVVLASAFLISIIFYHRHESSLHEALAAQAQNLAQATALQAEEKVLINDLVALQKMLDQQRSSHREAAYLFVVRNDRVLAHTFAEGVPAGLLKLHEPSLGNRPSLRRIKDATGEEYLDVAWPIFNERAGILRLGVSEAPLQRQLRDVLIEVTLTALGILLLSLIAVQWFVRRLTRPLTNLAQATQLLDQGKWDVRVEVQGRDEVALLAESFNQMVRRLEEYTRNLEQKTLELTRANQQTGMFCEIVQKIGALRTLADVGSFLVKRLRAIAEAHRLLLLVLNVEQEALYLLSENGAVIVDDPELVRTAGAGLKNSAPISLDAEPLLPSPPLPEDLFSAARHNLVTLEFEGQIIGGLLIACPVDCPCEDKDLTFIRLILQQAAGVIRRAVIHEEELNALQRRYNQTAEFMGLVGKDPKMHTIFRLIEDVAPTDATVLIQGESGTGKELVARAIHQKSYRRHQPFVVINCAAYPATLLESELFGHEKGSFTGAVRQKIGRFEQAQGGTVFLDEVAEIPLPAQVKLLRVLQIQEFERVGGEKTIRVDVRLLAASHRDLRQAVKEGQFREDLYYRLNVVPIALPPLRERRNDVPLLARSFLKRLAEEHGKNIKDFSQETMRILLDAEWPGNVRELENTLEHAVVLAKGDLIEIQDLPPGLNQPYEQYPRTILDHERKLLNDTLETCGWNKVEAARRLGISRSTLYQKVKKYNLSRPTTH